MRSPIVLLLLAIATTAQAQPGEPAGVRILSEASIGGWEILLGDVAVVEGQDDELVGRLMGESLQTAPLPNISVYLTQDDIARVLLDRGYSSLTVRLSGAERVRVSTLSRTISGADVRQMGLDHLRKALAAQMPPGVDPIVETEVQPVGELADLAIPTGRRGSDIRFVGKPGVPSDAETTITAQVVVDGRVVRKVPVRYRLRHFRTLPVPLETIPRGDAFDSVRVEPRRVEVPEGATDLITDTAAFAGAIAARTLTPLTPIQKRDLVFPVLVKRGRVVTVLLRTGSLTINTQARAREDGKLGEMVTLENLDSGKILRATVVADGVTEVVAEP